jgi:hypothetical protein
LDHGKFYDDVMFGGEQLVQVLQPYLIATVAQTRAGLIHPSGTIIHVTKKRDRHFLGRMPQELIADQPVAPSLKEGEQVRVHHVGKEGQAEDADMMISKLPGGWVMWVTVESTKKVSVA